MLSCSIIIISYNSCDFIPACLKSVRDACEGIDSQIIVLDNGSNEPIIPEIKNFFPEVEWIDSKENLGFGKGCNLAEKHATKPYLFFINPDTIISKNAFREMLKFMEEHPDAGTVGCRIGRGILWRWRGPSGLRWVWRNGRGPHLEGRQEPQASSAFRTPTAGSLQSWDRRVRPRLV